MTKGTGNFADHHGTWAAGRPRRSRGTLQRRPHALAPGLTAHRTLEKFAAVRMIDVHLPTTGGRELLLTRYTQPEPELQLLIRHLKLQLPDQPPPKIATAAVARAT